MDNRYSSAIPMRNICPYSIFFFPNMACPTGNKLSIQGTENDTRD